MRWWKKEVAPWDIVVVRMAGLSSVLLSPRFGWREGGIPALPSRLGWQDCQCLVIAMWRWLSVILLLSTTRCSFASFASLAAKAMCLAEGCTPENSSCLEVCVPTKTKYVTGREIQVIKDSRGPEKLDLICHGTDRIALKWCETPELIYIIEYSIAANSSWTAVGPTSTCSLVLPGLKPNSQYNVSLRGVRTTGQVGETISSEFSTLPHDVAPATVDSVELQQVWADGPHSAFASLNWTLSSDLPCQYGLVLWKITASSHANMTQVKYPDKLSQTLVPNLEFEAEYKFGVRALNGPERESEVTWRYFDVPSCLHFYPGNLSVCRPSPPKGLIAEEHLTELGKCELLVEWSLPADIPAHYNLTVAQYNSMDVNYKEFLYTLSGNCTETVVPDLVQSSDVLLTLYAESEGGSSPQTILHLIDICSNQYIGFWHDSLKQGVFSARIAGILSVFFFLLIFFTLLLLVFFKQKAEIRQGRCDYFKSMKKMSKSSDNVSLAPHESDEYEITKDSLLLCDVIGEGAFGVVHKGLLSRPSGAPQEVAVKKLRDNPTAEESRQFQKEIAVMKTVGQHKNIVSLIGCCTQSCRLLLIVEFCALGDLQNYLRQEWKKQMESVPGELGDSGNVQYADIMTVQSNGSYAKPITLEKNTSSSLVSNAMYDFYVRTKEDERKSLAERLLSFSRQIAVGMEYLSSNRVVHRDLAARNVLVCNDQSVKISDFGLSRDIYEQNIYCKKSSEKLPVKWMALESLLHQIYTTQSDVWSFGVLLWEIVTLGGNPYPSTPTSQMFRLLKHGFRMEQPPTCSNELYSIMLSCWREKPSERPTFPQLVRQLTELLEAASPHQYLDLSQLDNSWGRDNQLDKSS